MKEIKQNIPVELQLSTIKVLDPGHKYEVKTKESGHTTIIQFGKGGRNTPERTPGMDHQVLAYILIDRLKYFKELFPQTDENDEPLMYIEKALHLMEKRTLDRFEAGTLGNNGEDYKEE